jgi:hypothetical protein
MRTQIQALRDRVAANHSVSVGDMLDLLDTILGGMPADESAPAPAVAAVAGPEMPMSDADAIPMSERA